MAGTQELDTGQYITYLFLLYLPRIIGLLIRTVPKDEYTLGIFRASSSWLLRGTHRTVPRKKVKRDKKPRVRLRPEGGKTTKQMRTYLVPIAMATFWVGCRVERFLRRLGRPGRPPSRFTALSSAMNPTFESNLHFDSDSYPIGVDNHASRCMANAPHLFRDLKLIPEGEQVSGIGEGLAIKGVGTYIMRINDDNGKLHEGSM